MCYVFKVCSTLFTTPPSFREYPPLPSSTPRAPQAPVTTSATLVPPPPRAPPPPQTPPRAPLVPALPLSGSHAMIIVPRVPRLPHGGGHHLLLPLEFPANVHILPPIAFLAKFACGNRTGAGGSECAWVGALG